MIWQSQRSHTFIALLCYVQRHVPHYLLQFANFDTWVWELQGALSLRLNFELLTLIINYPTHLCFEFLFWPYSNLKVLMLGLSMAKQQSGLPSFKTLGGWVGGAGTACVAQDQELTYRRHCYWQAEDKTSVKS